jgi:ribosomal protein S18 acetylase RimI-like enzyme
MQDLLPRLFLQHFTATSTVAETPQGDIAGFLIGFVSQDHPEVGYIHFVGVHPLRRGEGLGARLYERAFEDFRSRGCAVVKAVTSPVNTGSLAFHEAMGFTRVPDPSSGSEVWTDYDGPGGDRVVLTRSL